MEKGDFVEIDYIAKIKDSSKYFDVTNEDKAKEIGLFQKNKIYKPIKIVVGAKHVIEGLDNTLVEMEVGEEKDVEISPELGFGKRNPKLITTIPMREFSKQGIMPRPGLSIDIGGKWATVRNVSSGRVTLDFNHALAGRTLEYRVKIISRIDDTKEKLEAIIEFHLGDTESKKTEVTVDGEKATIKLSGMKKNIEEIIKKIIEEEAGKYISEIKEIEFIN
ncbi:MAG: FKBP-type peptidyl-prolyl cis-trans isomerase [Candidatus Methanofastidiosia archaeon]